MASNGINGTMPTRAELLNRADEVDDVSNQTNMLCTTDINVQQLLKAVQSLIIPFIRSADEDASTKHTGNGLPLPGGGFRASLVEHHKPEKLVKLMNFDLPNNGKGKEGLLYTVEQLLKYSVNTWDQGFLDKLYASTNAVRNSISNAIKNLAEPKRSA
jgi:glutamate decarboxylase